MNKNIQDQAIREEALNPSQSFIVQAPAGSGKTDLLVKRFLRLLTIVKTPEEILAITFTRKAAAEMRSRILEFLTIENHREDSEHLSSDNLRKWVEEIRERDKRLQWNLLENPNRLRVQTIDAFCRNLINQVPLLSRHLGNWDIIENPQAFYQQAVENLIASLDSEGPLKQVLTQLLAHLDNQLPKMMALLVDMLSKRDQWLFQYQKQNVSQSRDSLEKGLVTLNEEIIEDWDNRFPKALQSELLALIHFALEHLEDGDEFSINALFDVTQPLKERRRSLQWIADFLLTDSDICRSAMTAHQGFPAITCAKNKEEKELFRNHKERMEGLLDAISKHIPLCETLVDIRYLPPLQYTDQQWAIIGSLYEVLKHAVAELKWLFNQERKTDFIEVAQAALQALGTSENPTDLSLLLDYKIQHILMDEFQDTSLVQFKLIEQLIAGWQPNDGRSLFLVGDPMQSIYRFRDAEVGLFLRAQRESMGSIALKSLSLSVNFRSDSNLIHWFNQVLPTFVPSEVDINSGAVPYSESSAYRTGSSEEEAVQIHPLLNPDESDEAQKIASIIQSVHKKHPEYSIAILVKARSHLEKILPVLRQQSILYEAVDIDPLSKKMLIEDLVSLTHAVVHPADRMAWLAVLRTPWVGLNLNDLTIVASGDNEKTIWQNLGEVTLLNRMSSSGREKISFLKSVTESAWKEKGRKPLNEWIYQCWIDLKGPSYLRNKTELEETKAYFELIGQINSFNDLFNFPQWSKNLDNQFVTSQNGNSSAVQVMTIHRAKGLEFDVIILPGLERISQGPDPQLLMWMERTRRHRGEDLIVGPFQKTSEPSVYSYLRRQEALKDQFEEMRLLYVAMTRAKKQLHLLGSVSQSKEGSLITPRKGSFLYWLRESF